MQASPTKVKVKFTHTSKALTYATSVQLRADVHHFDEYITGEDYDRTNVTFGTSWSTEHTVYSEENAEAKVKDDYNVDMQWRYQVKAPAGTDEWVSTGDVTDLRYYLLWGPPDCLAGDFIDSRIKYLVDAAEGAESSACVADSLGPDLTSNDRFGGNCWRDSAVWQVLDDSSERADCGTLSRLLKYGLALLGVDGAEVRFVYARHNSWTGLWSTSDARSNGEMRDGTLLTYLGYMATNGFNFYEGCCYFGGKWWMGGEGSTQTSAHSVLLHVTQPNTAGSNHQAYRDDKGSPVSYPSGTP